MKQMITAVLAATALCVPQARAEQQTLSSQLDEVRKGFSTKAPPEAIKTMADAEEALRTSHILKRAMKVGARAPLFELPDENGKKVAIFEHLEQGPVVVVFYRGGWCPYCNLQLRAMQQVLPELEKLGAQLVAISPQKAAGGLATSETHGLGFPLLVDANNDVARAFGLVFDMSEELDALYKTFEIDVREQNGTEKAELPLAATYVIGADGVISYAFVDEAYYKRAEPSDVVAAVRKAIEARQTLK